MMQKNCGSTQSILFFCTNFVLYAPLCHLIVDKVPGKNLGPVVVVVAVAVVVVVFD